MIKPIAAHTSDRRATDLAWSLRQEPQEALAGLDLDTRVGTVHLRVVGASHQVVIDGPGVQLVETVAALGGDAPGLPRERREAVGTDGAVTYRFHSRVSRPEDFGQAVDRLVAELERHPRAVVGNFDGDPRAITALGVGRAEYDELTWETWHAYPATGEIVSTATTLSR